VAQRRDLTPLNQRLQNPFFANQKAKHLKLGKSAPLRLSAEISIFSEKDSAREAKIINGFTASSCHLHFYPIFFKDENTPTPGYSPFPRLSFPLRSKTSKQSRTSLITVEKTLLPQSLEEVVNINSGSLNKRRRQSWGCFTRNFKRFGFETEC
jgi:hypothetical protein